VAESVEHMSDIKVTRITNDSLSHGGVGSGRTRIYPDSYYGPDGQLTVEARNELYKKYSPPIATVKETNQDNYDGGAAYQKSLAGHEALDEKAIKKQAINDNRQTRLETAKANAYKEATENRRADAAEKAAIKKARLKSDISTKYSKEEKTFNRDVDNKQYKYQDTSGNTQIYQTPEQIKAQKRSLAVVSNAVKTAKDSNGNYINSHVPSTAMTVDDKGNYVKDPNAGKAITDTDRLKANISNRVYTATERLKSRYQNSALAKAHNVVSNAVRRLKERIQSKINQRKSST